MTGRRLEDDEVLEIGEKGEHHLIAYVRNLQFSHHQLQMSHRTCPSRAAVADEACRLVVPLLIQEIDGALEGAGNAVVSFWRHENEDVEGYDLNRPGVSVRL